MTPRLYNVEDEPLLYDDEPTDYEPDDEELEYEAMFSQVGYFITQYSNVEVAITALLAILSKFDDFEAFHIITKGMDAKTKVERLRELAKAKKLIPKDGHLDKRLLHFADKTATLRNKVAHTWLLKSKGEPQKILFSNLARLPFDLFKMKKRPTPKPDEILVDVLWEHSNWLSQLLLDMLSLIEPAKKGTTLELKKPNSLEPAAFLQHLQQLETRAKNRTRRQSPKKK